MRINDSLGHAAGDYVLGTCAAILRREGCAGNLPARIGREEFALILAVDSKHHAAEKPEFTRHACKSAGWHEIDSSPSERALYALADRRLHCAKPAGRDRPNFQR